MNCIIISEKNIDNLTVKKTILLFLFFDFIGYFCCSRFYVKKISITVYLHLNHYYSAHK